MKSVVDCLLGIGHRFDLMSSRWQTEIVIRQRRTQDAPQGLAVSDSPGLGFAHGYHRNAAAGYAKPSAKIFVRAENAALR